MLTTNIFASCVLQVSCTVSFDPKTEGPQLPSALDYFQYQLKGVSFLPNLPNSYPQMPYEAISEETFHQMMAKTRPLRLPYKSQADEVAAVPDKFCDSASCEIPKPQ